MMDRTCLTEILPPASSVPACWWWAISFWTSTWISTAAWPKSRWRRTWRRTRWCGCAGRPRCGGTVVSNLRALKVQVAALGAIGDDGEGYRATRVGSRCRVWIPAPCLRLGDRYTADLHKPMMQ